MNGVWRVAIDGWSLELCKSTRSAATVDGYVKHLTWLAESVQAGPWDLTSAELGAWLDGRGWSLSTRRGVLVSLRGFHGWAVSQRLCEWAPTAGLSSATPRTRGPRRWHVLREALKERRVPEGAAPARSSCAGGGLGRLAEQSPDPWKVTSQQQLATWLSNPDWKAETKRAGRSAVRCFYGWAVKGGRLAVSPAADLDSVMLPRALPRPAPDDALRTALLRADDRTRLALMLAGYAGLRSAEIAALHTRQIAGDELLEVGKGGHHRRVPLHPHLRSELDAEMARRRRGAHGSGFSGRFLSDTGYVFPSDRGPGPITSHHLSMLVGRVLPDAWTTHSLRHRFATAAYLVERDLRAVQELLGHSKPETTARYAAVPEGALRSAVAGVGVGP